MFLCEWNYKILESKIKIIYFYYNLFILLIVYTIKIKYNNLNLWELKIILFENVYHFKNYYLIFSWLWV